MENDLVNKIGNIKWFGDKIDRSPFRALGHVPGQRVGRNDDYRRMPRNVSLLEFTTNLKSVGVWQPNIQGDEVKFVLGRQLQRLFARMRRFHFEANPHQNGDH